MLRFAGMLRSGGAENRSTASLAVPFCHAFLAAVDDESRSSFGAVSPALSVTSEWASAESLLIERSPSPEASKQASGTVCLSKLGQSVQSVNQSVSQSVSQSTGKWRV
mmetsp:Transcript_8269/g.25603  ORF Transcript_8269/g.25603 Transcript_8269/m.25603 type:complete len:108 (-) Transcript_8269:72-395(-)